MICKHFLLFGGLPFRFVDGFFRCAEAFQFDVVPFSPEFKKVFSSGEGREWSQEGTHRGFGAINNILLHFEKSDAFMKILRFGKAVTVYRNVDHIAFKIACMKLITFLKVHICLGTLCQKAILESKRDL